MTRAALLAAVAVIVAVAGGPAATADPGFEVPITVENTSSPVAEPATGGAQHLASTGADVVSMIAAGLAMIAAGALAVGAAGRRRGPA